MQYQYRLPRWLRALIPLLLFSLVTLVPAAPLRAAGVIYVVPGGASAQTGADWANAKELQAALAAAISGDQIWVKAGVYKPTTGADRSATFQLKSGVALYGGFAGTEASLDQRDPNIHISTLNGDLLGNDSGAVASSNLTRSENSYHVVTSNSTDNMAILDGFTITGGNANVGMFDVQGGGLLNVQGRPVLRDLIIINNSAATAGGGMFNYLSSNPILYEVSFINNTAGDNGGGLTSSGNSVFTSSVTMSRILFSGNTAPFGGGVNGVSSDIIIHRAIFQGNRATLVGGGILSNYGHTTITQAIFNGNTAESYGSAMAYYQADATISQATFSANWSKNNGGALANQESSPLIRNSVLWGNQGGQIYNYLAGNAPDVRYSLIQGGYITGTNILDADPLFVDVDGADNIAGTADDDLRLQAASPAIGAGSNAFIPSDLTDDNNNNDVNESAPFDLDGNLRLNGSSVDLGAYEAQLHLQLTSALPPNATYGGSYNHLFTTSSQAPVNYSITQGSLPPGLVLGATTGLLSGTPTAAGSYDGITITANTAAGSASQAFAILIHPAELTITADSKIRLFGAPNPQLTAGYSGFVNGDTPASLDLPASLTTTATINSPPGRYPITVSGAADANYDITFANATLTITSGRTYLALVSR
ncbi:MAG TPA: MBG domain-containing protein [Roseiflexaceae bacterium]|nr:MBG domain-containing protein [Roseiflexaceae bacterium]